MAEDKIKEAFQKVKEDMILLLEQLNSITEEIKSLKRTFRQTDRQTNRQTDNFFMQTQGPAIPTDTQTYQTTQKNMIIKQPLEVPKWQNSNISTGNRGVQTDRQTNQQTDRQTNNYKYLSTSTQHPSESNQKFALNETTEDPVTKIGKVAELINSLDALKKDLRRQFKRLTPQEMLVYSTIYQLTDQAIDVDYSILSKKTGLSESSIRDYVQKLLKKGIPLEKTRENNKRILLAVPPEFKRMTSLETIISLRSI